MDQCNPWIGLLLAFVLGLHSLYYQMSLKSLWASYGTPPEGSQVPLRAWAGQDRTGRLPNPNPGPSATITG